MRMQKGQTMMERKMNWKMRIETAGLKIAALS